MRQRQRAKNILIFLEAINDAEDEKGNNMSYINCLQGSAEKNSENELLELFFLGGNWDDAAKKNLS